MQRYVDTFLSGFSGYWNYLVDEVTNPDFHNYFYWLVALSILVWGLEIFLPWRRNQSIFRRDFWMDGFYMFFNFFLFSLVVYNAISNVGVELFNDFLGLFGVTNLVAIELGSWSRWAQLLALFLIADFVQWNIHRLLHRVPFLWEFHKVHHSVKEMGFAAHLRFHWMETVVYKTLQYIPLAMIGFSIQDFFLVHITALFIGHINHANLGWDYGPLKYILNNPKMHIWHHAKELPKEHKYGMNYGLTFSFWDYIFGTAYVPKNGKDIELGFPDEKEFPKSFWKQILYPFLKK